MTSALAHRQDDAVRDGEQRILLTGISWEAYEAMRDALDDHPGIRMSYLNGNLEIMSPSITHEFVKTCIGRLLERYAEEREIRLSGYGSATFRARAKERGLEPDECYVFGSLKDVPDIAIEVVVSHGGIDRLEIYRGLGVPEVWFWQDGAFAVYSLQEEGYELLERSGLLPELDLVQLAEYVSWPDQLDAVRGYVTALRRG